MGTSAFSYASFPWSKTSSRRSGGIVCDRRHCEATTICSKNARRLVRQQLAARPSVTTMLATESPSTSISSIKSRLRNAMEGLNFGLSIDADAEIMTEQEGEVEALIDQLEDMNKCETPARDDRNNGTWQLLYTSSTITRYFGGVTGLHRYVPDGKVEKIEQELDMEDGTATMTETIGFDVPFVDKRSRLTAVIQGDLRPTSEIRQAWNAKNVRVAFFSWFADNWKTLRSFKIADTTYLDHNFRITRGQTGSVCVYVKNQSTD